MTNGSSGCWLLVYWGGEEEIEHGTQRDLKMLVQVYFLSWLVGS